MTTPLAPTGNRRHCLGLLVSLLLCLGCAHAVPESDDPLAQARRHLAAAPQDVRIHIRLAELYAANKDYLHARQYLALVERNPDAWADAGIEPARVFRLGLIIAVRGRQYNEAIRRCEERLVQGEELEVRALLAALLEGSSAERAAERQRQLILVYHPDDPHQLIELARFYERNAEGRADRKQRARSLYERYLTLSPTGPEVPQAKGALLAFQLDDQLAKE